MKVSESAATYPQKGGYTYADYLKLPDDRNIYQIIRGELIVTPAPKTRHQIVSAELEYLLQQHVRKNDLGIVLYAPVDLLIADDIVLEPDILFISKARMNIIMEKYIDAPPELVVEVLSPSTAYYDMVSKKDLYAEFGVKEYLKSRSQNCSLRLRASQRSSFTTVN